MASLVITEQTGVMMEAQHQAVDFKRELRCVRVPPEVTRIDCQPDRASELITPKRLLTQHVLAYGAIAAAVVLHRSAE
jgi:hypothetical protein